MNAGMRELILPAGCLNPLNARAGLRAKDMRY
jgi:hypothetical protein